MEALFIAVEYLSCLTEQVFACLFFRRHLGCREKANVLSFLVVPIMATGTYLLNLASVEWYVSSLYLLAIFCIYALVFFKGSVSNRILHAVTVSVILLFIDHIVLSLMMIFTTRWADSFVPMTGLRLIGVSLYIVLLLIVLAVLLKIKKTERALPIWYSLASVLIAAMGITIMFIHDSKFEKIVESGNDIVPCALINMAVALMCAASTLLLHFASVLYKNNLDSQKELQQAKLEAKHVDQVSSMYEYVREWRHDMKGLLFTMNSLLKNGEYEEAQRCLEQFDAAASDVSFLISTGNPSIDAAISGKLMEAGNAEIPVNTHIDLPPDVKIDPMDVCSVLINLLDNAIAAQHVLTESERSIDLDIVASGGMLKINVKNPCRGEYRYEDGELLSTKQNTNGHGIGLKRVRHIAEKHDGYVRLVPEENRFEATVLLVTDNEK